MLTTSNLLNHTPTSTRQSHKQSPVTEPESLMLTVEGRTLEVTFAKAEDTGLIDRVRQSLYHSYMQALALPDKREI